MVTGLLAVRRLGLAAAAGATAGVLAKVERVLPLPLRERALAVQDAVVMNLPPARQTPESATVLTLSQEVRQGRRVGLRYRSWHGEETARTLDPYGLVYQTGHWYAVG